MDLQRSGKEVHLSHSRPVGAFDGTVEMSPMAEDAGSRGGLRQRVLPGRLWGLAS